MVLDKLFEGPLVAGDIKHNAQIPYKLDIPKRIKDLPKTRNERDAGVFIGLHFPKQ